ncbi:MAG TPA: PA0069 family radical SAM protein [Trueperaceae bacterium]
MSPSAQYPERVEDEERREGSGIPLTPPRGRGASRNPGSRFDRFRYEPDPDAFEPDDALDEETRYLSDKSRSVVSRNDSPDIPFDISLNPYRGCSHGCSYCVEGDTAILMADGSYREIQSLRKGDRIYGTVRKGKYRRFVRTDVLDHWSSYRHAYRITLADGTELVTSGEHRFLTERGWKHVTGSEHGSCRRRHLTTNDHMLGTGQFAQAPDRNEAYRQGYLCGMIRGDGHLETFFQVRPKRQNSRVHQFRPALTDLQDWQKGFLAGIFDAEGSYRDGILRIHNSDDGIISAVCTALDSLGFSWTIDSRMNPNGKNLRAIRITGGLRTHLRFFHMTGPAIARKRSIEGQAIKNTVDLRVAKIEDLGVEIPMFDITTGTGDFIANGVVSHNCYARPSHEYLGLSPGLDFERMIMVKEDAPALLERELRKPSWEPKTMLLSGVTDPYQPIERKLKLTRSCLEVLRDFRHPVSVITKNHLVVRDIDILAELAKYDASHVTLSITTLNEDLRRKMEPRTSTGRRRVDAVRELSAAGIPVSVNIAPVIPALNDEEIPAILSAVADAGAKSAHFILIRLPGAVEGIFLDWLEAHFPDRKEKVLGRLRQARGGKLNEAAFGKRMRGEGPYAQSVRTMFHVNRKRHGLSERSFLLSGEHFRVPGSSSQPSLFESRDESEG